MKPFLSFIFFLILISSQAQENPNLNPVQTQTQLRVNELVDKKAEYHKLTNGVQDGYRIKIHFGANRDEAEFIRTKFTTRYTEYETYQEYQQPNFVILIGDFKTKLEAFEIFKKIQVEFPNAFIVKGKIRVLF